MQLDFPPDSPWAAVYQAIQTDCAAHGKSPETCDSEMHHGYVDNVLLLPLKFYSPDKLMAGEVLEYAYRFDRFSSVLAKHGFAVPMAADDFDAATADDAQLRTTLQAAADHATAEAIAEGFAPGSDAHTRCVAHALYEWGLANLDFANDCAEESPAHVAWKQRCGACTETSYIMYRLLRMAGLSPTMMDVGGARPTLDFLAYFEKLPPDQLWQEHVVVGVPLAGGIFLQVDVALREFDPNYPDPLALTPRQAVTDLFYGNRFLEVYEHQPLDTAALQQVQQDLGKVAPNDLRTLDWICGRDHEGLESTPDLCKAAWHVFQNYQILKPIAARAAMLDALQRGSTAEYEAAESEFEDVVRTLSVKEPRAAAKMAFGAAREVAQSYKRLVQHKLDGFSWSVSDQSLFSFVPRGDGKILFRYLPNPGGERSPSENGSDRSLHMEGRGLFP